ncbi:hypothetical protein [Rahnella sp. PAMC 25559]|uniref:capsular polysaccharide export protein, LipB/KpsS family n=1 Tax=Rahnella sp. PAMC 25559 TaxID=3423225 RepID=UPI003D67D3A4
MRVLFYLEVHPLRNSFNQFAWVGKEIINMLRKHYLTENNSKINDDDIRIVVSRHYKELTDSNQDIKTIFIGLTKEENDRLSFYLRDWNTEPEAIDYWTSLMNGKGEVSEFYSGILDRIKNNVFDFDVVVNWSTNGAVRDYCNRKGIHNVSMELGCVREPILNTICFDACGVNGNSIIRHVDLEAVDENELVDIKSILPVRIKNNMALDAVFKPIQSKYSEYIYSSFGKNVLIPLQLKDDSNRIIFSEYKGMLAFLKDVVPKLSSAGYTCIIKPHPMANASVSRLINKDDHEACKEYVDGFESDNIVWLDDVNDKDSYLALLNLVNFAVTINSSVGFEAMMLDIPTVVLGKSPFDVNTIKIESLLNDNIDSITLTKHNHKISNVIMRHYLVPQAIAFDFYTFMFNVKRAIKLEKILHKKGSKAFTYELCKFDNLIPYYENLNVPPQVRQAHNMHHKKYIANITPKKEVKAIIKLADASDSPQVVVSSKLDSPLYDMKIEKLNNADSQSNFKKKVIKFKRDPKRFFADSKNGYIRILSNFIP